MHWKYKLINTIECFMEDVILQLEDIKEKEGNEAYGEALYILSKYRLEVF